MSKNSSPVTIADRTYTAVFEPDEDGGFVVTVPVLPGCVTYGKTLAEAEEMAEEAITGFIETLRELGEDVPVEHGEPEIRQIRIPLAAL